MERCATCMPEPCSLCVPVHAHQQGCCCRADRGQWAALGWRRQGAEAHAHDDPGGQGSCAGAQAHPALVFGLPMRCTKRPTAQAMTCSTLRLSVAWMA